MVDVGFRDVGSFASGRRREEPTVGAPPSLVPLSASEPASVIVTPPPPRSRPTFGGDRGDLGGDDVLGLDPLLGHLAEVVAHGRTATPITIGFLGGPGSGKSFALGRTLAAIRDLATAAGKQGASPFVSAIHVQPIDAATLDADVMSGLAACLHAGLRQPYPDLAGNLAHGARDPHVVLRELNEKLDATRHRQDTERRALDDAGSRRARLTETVLFEAAGSQVDAFARANHTAIESRFAGFGIAGEPIRSYKEIVQYVAGSGGKLGLTIRALWAYKGQTKLIVVAILLLLAGIGLGIAIDTQDSWLESLRTGAKAGVAVAGWFEAHIGWLARARTASFTLATLALAFNLWRAFAFVTPIFKGARLLDSDLDTRRRDLDGLFAHQTKRVDILDGDVERLTREVAEAEKRLGGTAAARHEPSPFATSPALQAQGFFASLAKAMASGKGKTAPQRIVLAVDHLDAVAPERARAILDALHRGAGAGLVTLVAADPARLDPDGSRRGELTRWFEMPVRLDTGLERHDAGALVARALGRVGSAAVTPKNDGKSSALDEPLDDTEVALLTSLAPLAGSSPLAVKRFVSLYALCRLHGTARWGATALMLALAQGGTASEKAAVAAALAGVDPAAAAGFELPAQAGPRLKTALAAARDADGPFSAGEALTASRTAARFSLAG